ncbi:hypothetical protein KC318_g420 [Hortaea werneckii]|nr:hypothetical protein KC334_g669 [Hortaea werneckii]KAI7026499.1 hypothetical protein KC355_g633 [Hortaea werneckii]KAI7197576.1 hypothetical protein KC324_g4125 [Hortaea werneckii]KAI7589233.1 hypothetical protein KC316_g4061 [Hortaea werneckii]KAI7676213.1 hypothetical protein KC318_g420 [Hortaea werneckii]
MAPSLVSATSAANYAYTDRVVLCGKALEARDKANDLVERAKALRPRVSDKTAEELTKEKDDAKARAIYADKEEQLLATKEAEVAMSTRKVNRQLERLQQESQGFQEMAGIAKMRKACWKLLDKTHRLGEESERDGLQHYGKDQSGISIPTRLTGSDAFPTADIQEIMNDRQSDSWTLGQVFRRTKELKTAADEGRFLDKKVEGLERTVAERDLTIASNTVTIGKLEQTNSNVGSELTQLRDDFGRAKDQLAQSISLEEHQARLDSRIEEMKGAKEQAIGNLQHEHTENMVVAEERWRHELDTAKKNLSLAVKEKSELESQVASLKGSLDESKAEFDVTKKQLQAILEKDKTAASDAMQRMNELAEGKDRDRTAALEARDRLQGSLERERSLREEDRIKIVDLDQSLRDERARHRELQSAHGKQSEEHGRMREELKHLFKSESQLNERLAEDGRALATARSENSTLTKDLKLEKDRGDGLLKDKGSLLYESGQLRAQRELNEREIENRDRQITEKDQRITDLKGQVDRLNSSGEEAHGNAEKETSSLRGVLHAVLPVFDGRLADNLVCDNLVKGICRAKPAHATQTINPRAAPGYVWDVGLVLPEELASVELDESLPRRLWVRTCSTNEPRPSMVMVEACLLWFWRGRQFTPEDTRFMMAAAEMVVGHCRQASEAKDEAMLCSLARLALRIMELCLRSGVERSELGAMFWDFKELTVTSFCNRGDALTCALWDWVNSIVLLGTTPTSVPETLLQVAEMEEKDTVSDTDDPSSPRFMIASAGKSLLVDKVEGFVTELVEDEVDYTFMIPMGYRFTFRKGRRLRDNMDYRLPMLLGRDQYATFPYLVVHLPSVVDRRFEEVFPGAREEFEQLHGYPMLQGVPMQAPL